MYQNELYHHGVKGQQWGIRRYQNADGSLTSQGRQRIQSRVTRLDKRKSRLEEKKSKIDSKISNGSKLSIKNQNGIKKQQSQNVNTENDKGLMLLSELEGVVSRKL